MGFRVVSIGISLDWVSVAWISVEVPSAAPLNALLIMAVGGGTGLADDPLLRIGIVSVGHDSVTIVIDDISNSASRLPCCFGKVLSD